MNTHFYRRIVSFSFLVSAMVITAYATTTTTPNIGEQIYAKACSNCHAPSKAKAIHAPAAFDQKAWAARLANAKSKSGKGTPYPTAYDYLVHHVQTGHGLMQHNGLCPESNLPTSTCSKDNYIAAIKYMAGQSQSTQNK